MMSLLRRSRSLVFTAKANNNVATTMLSMRASFSSDNSFAHSIATLSQENASLKVTIAGLKKDLARTNQLYFQAIGAMSSKGIFFNLIKNIFANQSLNDCKDAMLNFRHLVAKSKRSELNPCHNTTLLLETMTKNNFTLDDLNMLYKNLESSQSVISKSNVVSMFQDELSDKENKFMLDLIETLGLISNFVKREPVAEKKTTTDKVLANLDVIEKAELLNETTRPIVETYVAACKKAKESGAKFVWNASLYNLDNWKTKTGYSIPLRKNGKEIMNFKFNLEGVCTFSVKKEVVSTA